MPVLFERDVIQLIALFTSEEPGAHPLEKHVALCMFCTWMYDPEDAAVFEHAGVVSSANIYLHCKDDRADKIPLSKGQLARALADPPLATDFISYFTELQSSIHSLTDIVSFFMYCPKDVVPSLNKAFHFIEQGGFIDRSQSTEDQREFWKLMRRKSSLKALWKQRAHTAPFVWSANFVLPELFELAPDDEGLFKITEKLLKRPEKLMRYFKTVKWCQNKLHNSLDLAARRNILLCEIPESLPSNPLKLGKFDAEQLTIIASYKHK